MYILLFRWRLKIEDFDLDKILTDEKSYEDILVYNIYYKSLNDSTFLRIRFSKIDEFIRAHDRTTIIFIIFWDLLMFYEIFTLITSETMCNY